MTKAVSFLLTAFVAMTYQGCGKSHTKYIEVAPIQTEVPVPKQDTPVVQHDPWLATGGKLFDPQSEIEPWAPLGSWQSLNPRVRVWVPHWLRPHPDLVEQAFQEIRTVTPEGDTRIDPTWRGVDCDATKPPVAVIIMDPYGYGLATDSKGLTSILAAGHQTNWSRVTGTGVEEWGLLYVAWRAKAYKEYPLLPALAHELRHFLTNDPLAGHPGGCCARGVQDP